MYLIPFVPFDADALCNILKKATVVSGLLLKHHPPVFVHAITFGKNANLTGKFANNF